MVCCVDRQLCQVALRVLSGGLALVGLALVGLAAWAAVLGGEVAGLGALAVGTRRVLQLLVVFLCRPPRTRPARLPAAPALALARAPAWHESPDLLCLWADRPSLKA